MKDYSTHDSTEMLSTSWKLIHTVNISILENKLIMDPSVLNCK